jgi:hypothetical protein
MEFLVDMWIVDDDDLINFLTEKLGVWMYGQDRPQLEPLTSEWIELGQELRDKVRQRIYIVGERSPSGYALDFAASQFKNVPGWKMPINTSSGTFSRNGRIKTGDENSEHDSELYFDLERSDRKGSSDVASEASEEIGESSMIAEADANELLAQAGVKGELYNNKLLSSLTFIFQEQASVIRAEQVSNVFQMVSFLDSVEELTPSLHNALEGFVERAAEIPATYLFMIGVFLHIWGDLDYAFEVYSIAYSRAEQDEGPEKYEFAQRLNEFLYEQEKFEEDEAFCRKLVSKATQEHGKEHKLTLKWLNNLATTLRKRDKYEEAEAILQPVWEIRKRTLGENQRDTLRTASALSPCMGDEEESEALCRQTLNRREINLGRDDLETLQSYEDLLNHSIRRKNDEETEKLYWEILGLQRLQFGDEDEDIRSTAWSLIEHLQYLEKYDLAEAVCLRLLKLDRKILGDQHRDTLMTVDNLRVCFKEQGKREALENLDRSVFKSFRKFYPFGHNNTLWAASRLLDTLLENEKDLDAEKFSRRMLNIDQSIVAANNCWRRVFAFDFGILLYKQEKWFEAENTFRDVLNTLRKNREDEEESKDGIADDSETNQGCAEDEDWSDYFFDEEEPNYITISDVLQELEYVLTQQGKEKEASTIRSELELKEAAGRGPSRWEDID